jgi:hypothetical protein
MLDASECFFETMSVNVEYFDLRRSLPSRAVSVAALPQGHPGLRVLISRPPFD